MRRLALLGIAIVLGVCACFICFKLNVRSPVEDHLLLPGGDLGHRLSEGAPSQSSVVRSLADGGVTLVETVPVKGSSQPFEVDRHETRPLSVEERASLEERLHRFLFGMGEVIAANTNGHDVRMMIQQFAARGAVAETLAALDCVERGQAFVLLHADGALRDTSEWVFRRERLRQVDGVRDIVIAIDLVRFPEIMPLRAELENVKRYKNDDMCAVWNAIDLEVRQKIVSEGAEAQRFMSRVQAEMVPLLSDPEASMVPASRVKILEWNRASAAVARVPLGRLGPNLEAIPGVTVFNGYAFAGSK